MFRDIDPAVLRRAGPHAVRGRCLVGPRGNRRLPRGAAGPRPGAVAAGAMGRDVPGLGPGVSDARGIEGGSDRVGGRRPGVAGVRRPSRARTARRASWRRGRRTSPGSPGPATSRPPDGWASPPRARWPTPGSSRSTRRGSAFSTFARVFGESSTLLVDTYDTLEGVRHAAAIEPPIPAIRIDSGDLIDLCREARAILDENGPPRREDHGLRRPRRGEIAATGRVGAPDGRLRRRHRADHLARRPGVGDGLQARRARRRRGGYKLSPGKKTYPMAKQVYRRRDADGRFASDHVTRADETAEGEPLLVPYIEQGRLVRALPTLDAIREHCRAQVERPAAPPPRARCSARLPVEL